MDVLNKNRESTGLSKSERPDHAQVGEQAKPIP